MSDRELSVLRILRIFGPCSNADVARRLRPLTLSQAYRAMQRLESQGLIIHPRLQRYDVSELGRDVLARLNADMRQPRLWSEA